MSKNPHRPTIEQHLKYDSSGSSSSKPISIKSRSRSSSTSSSVEIPIPRLQRAASKGEIGSIITMDTTYLQVDDIINSWGDHSPLMEQALSVEESLMRTKGRNNNDTPTYRTYHIGEN